MIHFGSPDPGNGGGADGVRIPGVPLGGVRGRPGPTPLLLARRERLPEPPGGVEGDRPEVPPPPRLAGPGGSPGGAHGGRPDPAGRSRLADPRLREARRRAHRRGPRRGEDGEGRPPPPHGREARAGRQGTARRGVAGSPARGKRAGPRPAVPGGVAPRLGLVPEEWSGPPGPGIARPLAAAEALFAVQGAPAVLGRPALFRSRAARTSVDPGLLDGLAGEGLVEKAFVLVCRSTGHIVGLGKESGEIHAAMQLALLCPHCRSPLGEEAHDVLYSLTAEGEEFLRTTRWIRGALEGALRARGCDPVLLSEETPAQRVDGAAWYHGTALLIRVGNG